MLDLINISILIVALSNGILGGYSFLQNKISKINRTFAYLSYSVVAWCIFMVVYRSVSEISNSILGCDGLTRSDFILNKNNQLVFLEINTIPGLTETSLCPKEAKAQGISFPEFLDMQIELGLKKASKKY